MSRTTTGIIAASITGFAALSLLVLVLAMSGQGQPSAATGQARHKAPSTKSPEQSPGDPWAECALVRHWLTGNLHDPDSLTSLTWKERREVSLWNKPCTSIRASYRSNNTQGARQLEDRLFFLHKGEIIHTSEVH